MLRKYAKVVELADSLDSGSSARKGVRVQIPPFAPYNKAPKDYTLGALYYNMVSSLINLFL